MLDLDTLESLNEHLVFIKDQQKRAEGRRSKYQAESFMWLMLDNGVAYWKGQVEGIEASIRIINSIEEEEVEEADPDENLGRFERDNLPEA